MPVMAESRSGITLIEIMIATVILATALIPIASIMGYGAKSTQKDFTTIEAIQLLEKTGNSLIQQPFASIPTGSLTSYPAPPTGFPPVVLGTITGRFNTTFSVSVDSSFFPITLAVRPVKVFTAGFNEAAPRDSDFDTAMTESFSNQVKKLVIAVAWTEPGGGSRRIEAVTYRAKLD